MMKLCDESIVKSISIIFKNLNRSFIITEGSRCCSNLQKRIKISHKKISPSFTLTKFWKFFRRLIFNSLFKSFDENELLNPNQLDFCQFDSCVNKFPYIHHEIFLNFDCDSSKNTSVVFLDIFKTFNKIWISGLIFKFKSFGILGGLLEIIKNFISNRFVLRVVMNRQTPE